MNTTNYFKDQRRPSSRLATIMFRGTPCIHINSKEWKTNFKDIALEI